MSCPICQSATDAKYRPFCSRRCADVDLARWFNGSYAAPSLDPDDAEKAIDEVEALMQSESTKPH
ncbi:MAG: DNA gyrase inhibitor YacG [Aestuariivita sp.]|uniref:DNA gyrase inhibitor YacG n=1 Tax=Aestuariivita sp. TaxID=1872407 RepID=UPI003BB015FA